MFDQVQIHLRADSANMLSLQDCKSNHVMKIDALFLMECCEEGQVYILKRIKSSSKVFKRAHAQKAAAAGQIKVLRWLNSINCSMIGAMQCAAQAGHLHILQWFHRNYDDCDDGRICSQAAEHGHLACLQWAHEHDYDWDDWTCSLAAKHGHLDCLKYAIENECYVQSKKYVTQGAAEGGHLHCLKYLHQQGYRLNQSTFEMAICRKHMHIARWMIKHGYTLKGNEINDVYQYGTNADFQWLLELGCKLTPEICDIAAERKDMKTLQLASAQGCHMSYEVVLSALKRKDKNMLKFAILNGADWPHTIAGRDYEKQFPNLFRWCIISQFPEHAHLYPDI